VRATMQALRQRYDGHKLLVVFQPHTHSRLDTFFDDFATSFDGADRVLVTDVYGARSVADASATVSRAAEAGGGEQAMNDTASAQQLAERIGQSTGVYTPSLQVCAIRLFGGPC
jgi:UDP-N-acetylmuramate-alanine ligase